MSTKQIVPYFNERVQIHQKERISRIKIGDLVILSQNEKAPCDLILLDASSRQVLVDSSFVLGSQELIRKQPH